DCAGVAAIRPHAQVADREMRWRIDADLRSAGPVKISVCQIELERIGSDRSLVVRNTKRAAPQLSLLEPHVIADECRCAVRDLTVDPAVDFELCRRRERAFVDCETE